MDSGVFPGPLCMCKATPVTYFTRGRLDRSCFYRRRNHETAFLRSFQDLRPHCCICPSPQPTSRAFLSHRATIDLQSIMPFGKNDKLPRRRHKHTISPSQHRTISASTPPHHQSQCSTATPLASSYTWQDLRKDPSVRKRATIATLGSREASTRGAKGAGVFLMAGGNVASMKMGASTHHPLFLPQLDVPKPRGMRPETDRRNLHYVLLKTD
jgi:hypothetical protein